ncbi:hypothetical protein ACFRIC_38205 [Streptomyces sp. NPDC056738]|uniref:hypothetical protein n=1 Tax=Streptomyces sp. NPDC056738 TaxID=3345933 RepID=UPI0036A88DFB
MRTRTTVVAIAIALAAAVTGCSSGDDTDTDAKATPKPTSTRAPGSEPSADVSAAEKAAGIPPVPTGVKRAQLLRALGAANPGIVKYEDKAIDAARNQCMAINGGGRKLDRTASQRFTYKDVTTTETQGKQINDALKGLGFCKA